VILILAAFITPSDPFSMFVLAIPLYGLYELSILVCKPETPSDDDLAE
jgi:sec-independent protein translocase protein TatC